jgi:hypothetical protein
MEGGRPEVVDPAAHLADALVGVPVLGHSERNRINRHRGDACTRVRQPGGG